MIWRIAVLAGLALVGCAALIVFTIEDRQEARQPEVQLAPAAEPGPARPKAFFAVKADAPALPAEPFLDGGGEEVTLADFKGKAVLLNLWATWCAPCVKELPSLARLQAKRGSDGFTVIALNLDRPGKANVPAFLNENGASGLEPFADPTLKMMRALRVGGLPSTILIGPDGREIARREGEADWDSNEAWAAIEKALGK
ncbi:MAG: TlpA family protein disulfide reductase [Alphaproteobacteria bacterium]|nr:TlpA family protein disulfide reductase [Alphaproteobacteria bacterium]